MKKEYMIQVVQKDHPEWVFYLPEKAGCRFVEATFSVNSMASAVGQIATDNAVYPASIEYPVVTFDTPIESGSLLIMSITFERIE